MSVGRHHRLATGEVVAGRYTVRRVIGRWRVGTAYDVFRPDGAGPLTLLALDLRKGQTSRYLRWVKNEADRNIRLPPNLILPLDGGHLAGEAVYMVLGPYRGRSLLQALRADGPFDAHRCARVGHRLAHAVALAHEGGVRLGSLRPTTTLLDVEGSDRPAIFDLGLARGLGELLVNAPRPARVFWPPDRTPDRRPVGGDDIFALGGLLYFMMTGDKPPRVDPEAGQVVTPPSWKLKDSELAAYLDPVVLKAMAPRPRDRYLSAHALSDALQALAEVFGLSPAAREVLGLDARESPSGAFRREPTSPYLLHDLMGLPADDGDHVTPLPDFDPDED